MSQDYYESLTLVELLALHAKLSRLVLATNPAPSEDDRVGLVLTIRDIMREIERREAGHAN